MTSCPAVHEHLSEYVDGTLDADDRAAFDAHLSGCRACRGAVQDLDRLRAAARALGPITPPAQVWTSIARSLPSARRQARAQWLGLAAALVLITAGAFFVARTTAPAPTPANSTTAAAGNASGAATVETIEQELAAAAGHYENAIAQLEAVAKQDTTTLPADAAAKLQVSLSQIDKYIAESRAALVNEPQSEPARDSLFDALRRKVSILQDTVALMGAMQRGDQEAAARIMGGKSS